MWMLALTSLAMAGDGPWTLAPGELNVYAGTTHFRYDAYDTGVGSNSLGGGGTIATHSVAVVTAGLVPGVETELRLPYETARVNDASIGACDIDPTFCARSRGLGDAEAVAKVRLVDEVFASPVSVALSAHGRTGEAYAAQRDRLTALGDGQTALGLGASVGRSAALGQGWYTASASATAWHRLALGDTWLAPEVTWSAVGTWSPNGRVALGPALYGFERLGGTDVAKTDFASPNALARLDGTQIQAGGKVAVYGRNATLHASVLRTVYARNNPADTLAVSVGVGWYLPDALDRLGG